MWKISFMNTEGQIEIKAFGSHREALTYATENRDKLFLNFWRSGKGSNVG